MFIGIVSWRIKGGREGKGTNAHRGIYNQHDDNDMELSCVGKKENVWLGILDLPRKSEGRQRAKEKTKINLEIMSVGELLEGTWRGDRRTSRRHNTVRIDHTKLWANYKTIDWTGVCILVIHQFLNVTPYLIKTIEILPAHLFESSMWKGKVTFIIKG